VNATTWNISRLMVAALAVAALAASFTPTALRLETPLLGWGSRLMPTLPAPVSVAVVAIDQATLDSLGGWPWPRERILGALERLRRFQPAAVGVMVPLSGAETPPVLHDLHAELDSLQRPPGWRDWTSTGGWRAPSRLPATWCSAPPLQRGRDRPRYRHTSSASRSPRH
jgi:hypothetical protein